IQYLLNFIHNGPSGYAPYCAERLRRTYVNGARTEPPSWLELQATKQKKPIMFNVTLMNGQSITVPADSASIAKEICQFIADKTKLKDIFGFSLYIAVFDKVWSLGGGRDHVLDAISQCEQLVKERGTHERHAPWRLYFRKEIFTPWHNSQEDPISTDLIYHQVIRGIRFGEYRCEKEEDLVEIGAKYCYIQFGDTIHNELVQKVLHDCIPVKQLKSKPLEKWVSLITYAHAKAPYTQDRLSHQAVKEQLVDFARFQWPLLFSRFFEVTKFSGPSLPKNHFILAVNWKGICFLDESEKRLLELTFPEITGIHTNRAVKSFGQSCTLITLRAEEFVLTSVNSIVIAELVVMFLEGLKKRSRFAVAMHEKKSQEDPTILSFKKGDLLILTEDKRLDANSGWIHAQNDRTGKMGNVFLEEMYIIPSLTKPSSQPSKLLSFLQAFSFLNFKEAAFSHFCCLVLSKKITVLRRTMPGTDTSLFYNGHSNTGLIILYCLPLSSFRTPEKESISKAVLQKSRGHSQLWAHSKDPLKQPLLKAACTDPDVRDAACQAFIDILLLFSLGPENSQGKEDWPTNKQTQLIELNPTACGQRKNYVWLQQNHLLCAHRYSVTKGWQLLWLCTGLFPPSKSLLKHAQKFIETRQKEPLALECKRRIQTVMRSGSRKWAPHSVEVEAILQNNTKISHKICFPNETEQTFDVGTNTKNRTLCQNIASKLQLSSWEGFSLFVKIADKVISQNEADYFFDSLRQLTDWTKRNKPVKDGKETYLLQPFLSGFKVGLFQELPKYLRGYHNCSRDEAVQLAGLVYKVRFNNDRTQLATIPKILKELVPDNLLRVTSPDEWKKSITAAYSKHEGKTVDEAKIAFLKIIYRWPTFGSAFFEVKQTSEPNFPEIVLIAINKQGVSLIHQKTKEILTVYPFNKISNWSSGSTFFHMTIGNLVRGSRILCETSLGYKMDDLLTSYVHLLMNAVNKQKSLPA
uniref:Myosin VIIB n=1 Tax=Pavo cristatus TaxID=9049 RepID=A0A8C9ERM7_PAVCR